MRHRKRGRTLGRSPSHRKAMRKNMLAALFLTEREIDDPKLDPNPPKVRGRIVTTVAKAKEMRPEVEKCITKARRAYEAIQAAKPHKTDAQRGTDAYEAWKKSDKYKSWVKAVAPAVAIRRRLISQVGDKKAVSILINTIAPRFLGRPGGYTRILKLATPRLGDAGPRAILEFVGKNDRRTTRSAKPAFEGSNA